MLSRRFRRVKWLALLGFTKHRDVIDRWRGWGLTSLLFSGLAFLISLQSNYVTGEEEDLMIYSYHTSRRLLTTDGNETSKCQYEENHLPIAWVISHCICTLIVFIALAIICDDFFVPSLEIISEKLNLSEDVAGATFMAAGSSAPELFTSVAGVAQETDVGVGTIVGSAVFNLLIIIALTAALAGKVLHLDWRPLVRDSFFYAMSIGCFIGFSWDGYFQHYEAAILLSLYVLYIVIMIFNPKLVAWMATWERCCKKPEVSPTEDGEKQNDLQTQLSHIEAKGAEGRRLSLTGGHARRLSIIQRERSQSEERIFRHKRGSVAGVLICPPPKYLTGRKDSGVAAQENSSGVLSTETSHTDVQRSSADGAERPKSRTGLRNGYLSTNRSASPTDVIEMAAVELPAITKATNGPLATKERTSRYKRTYSEDIPSLREEDGAEEGDGEDDGKLQRSASERRTPDSQRGTPTPGQRRKTANTTTTTTTTTTPNANANTTNIHENNNYSNSQMSASDKRQVSGQEARRLDLTQSDPCPSDSALQNSTAAQREKIAAAAAGSKDVDDSKKQADDDDDDEQEETMQICPCCPCCPPVRTYPPSSHDAREKGGFVNWLKLIIRWIIFIPAFPFVCLFSWTIPECSKQHLRKYYLLSFFMSVAWIAALSYAMVTVVERTGCILGVDSYVMGLVVVAIGTSVPDAMSSILVARDGYGDMAVSNAIGSNVFDINLGLGLPFIIRIAIDKGAPIAMLETSEWVAHFSGKMALTPHAKFGFILLVILFLCLLIFIAVRFRLNKWIGITFCFMYVLFLVYAFIQELYCTRKLEIYC